MLGFLRCLLLRHEPDRHRVKKVGNADYYGYCRHCGGQIMRVKRDRWVRARVWPHSTTE